MEKRILTFAIIILLFLSAGTVYFFVSNPGVHDTILTFSNDVTKDEVSVLNLIKPSLKRVGKEEGNHDFSFEFPKNVDVEGIEVSSDYLEKTFDLSVTGIDEYYFLNFPVEGESDIIEDVVFKSSMAKGDIKLKFKKYTCTRVEKNGRFVYLDFLKPSEYYDKIVVVDPEPLSESADINLAIAKEVSREFEDDEKIGIFCTRLTDTRVDIEKRLIFADDVGADLYININQNSTASGRESDINGTETRYYSADKSGMSKKLATNLLENVTMLLESKNMGTVAGDGNMILQSAKCPAAILNVGYITNKNELKNLNDIEYQKKCAEGIKKAVLEYLYEDSNSNG